MLWHTRSSPNRSTSSNLPFFGCWSMVLSSSRPSLIREYNFSWSEKEEAVNSTQRDTRYAIRSATCSIRYYVNTLYSRLSIRSTLQGALRSSPHSGLSEPFTVSSLWPREMVLKQNNTKKRENPTRGCQGCSRESSGWWISGSAGRWQRTSNTHSARHMFGAKDSAAEFRIKVSSQMSQRGGGGCGLGVDTERMALTHIYIYIFTYKFLWNIHFIAGLCNFLVTPHPVCHAYVFVFRGGKIYPYKEGRVLKFQHDSLTEGWFFRLWITRKNCGKITQTYSPMR